MIPFTRGTPPFPSAPVPDLGASPLVASAPKTETTPPLFAVLDFFSPTTRWLWLVRLGRCSFSTACTEQDAERLIDSKKDFFSDFVSVFRTKALANNIPESSISKQIEWFQARVFAALHRQKEQAVQIVHSFAEFCSSFPSSFDSVFSQICVEDQACILAVRRSLEAFTTCGLECWKSLAYLIRTVPRIPNLLQTSLGWLTQHLQHPSFPDLIRAVGYATHIPPCSKQQLSSLLQGGAPVWSWIQAPLSRDEFFWIVDLVAEFHAAVEPLVHVSLRRLSQLLRRNFDHRLCSERSPFYLDHLALAAMAFFRPMPAVMDQVHQVCDADVFHTIFVECSSSASIWSGKKEETIPEFFVIFSHLQQSGLFSRSSSYSVLRALQEVREDILLREDPFLLEHPISDPGLTLLSLSADELQPIAACAGDHRNLKRALMAIR